MRHRDYKTGRERGKFICIRKLIDLKKKYFNEGFYYESRVVRECIKVLQEEDDYDN